MCSCVSGSLIATEASESGQVSCLSIEKTRVVAEGCWNLDYAVPSVDGRDQLRWVVPAFHADIVGAIHHEEIGGVVHARCRPCVAYSWMVITKYTGCPNRVLRLHFVKRGLPLQHVSEGIVICPSEWVRLP